jgi:hypothetical protein
MTIKERMEALAVGATELKKVADKKRRQGKAYGNYLLGIANLLAEMFQEYERQEAQAANTTQYVQPTEDDGSLEVTTDVTKH